MWEQHAWVFDLVSRDELRRRRARMLARERDEAYRAAIDACNALWFRAGGTYAPADPALAAQMDQAQAAQGAAGRETFRAPIWAYLNRAWDPQWDRAAHEPYAVVYLEWEVNWPGEWRETSGICGSSCGTKDSILKTMGAHGVTQPNREAVEKVVLTAVRGPYRAADWRYARVARHLDGPSLRDGLAAVAGGRDEAAALRAEFVLSRLDHPDLSGGRRSYGKWLKQRAALSQTPRSE